MNFFEIIKGVWRKLFGNNSTSNTLSIKPAISQTMITNVNKWYKCYAGEAEWTNNDVKSLRLEKSIVREFANIVLNEMTVSISNQELQDLYDSIKSNELNIGLQQGLAMGAFVVRPLGEGKNRAQFLSQNNYIPLKFNDAKRLTEVIFPDIINEGKRIYMRLEHHSVNPETGLSINNYAVMSKDDGNSWVKINLNSVPEWADIEESVTYPEMLKPDFGYYCNPFDNTIDQSPCGVSVFEPAIDIIRKADVQFGRLDWEFESGERAIFVDVSLMKNQEMNKMSDRLYQTVDADGDEDLIHEHSPALREADYISGLDEYVRKIEFAVGLSYGDISNPQSVEKTAEEIKVSKQRKYNTVSAIQENLKDCLEDFVYALAFWNALATKKYDFVCDFKDSVLTNEKEERENDRQDLASGIMSREEYRAKWYGEDIEVAREKLPKQASLIE